MLVIRRSHAIVGAGFALGLACSSDNGTDPDPDPDPDTTPAAIDVVNGDGQDGTVGSALGAPLVVEVTNAGDDALGGVSVQWSVQAGGGTLGASSTNTNAQGRAQVTYTLGGTPGTNTVRATVAGTSLTVDFTLTGNPQDVTPASITIADGDTQSGTAGVELAEPLAVVVRNAALETLSGISVTWTVTEGQGGGATGSATSVTNAQGIASTTYTLGSNPGDNLIEAAVESDPSLVVTFTATGTAPITSAGVDVEDNQFVPDEVTVSPGATVTWTWGGAVDHNVTWQSGSFQNSPNQTVGTHQVTFANPGMFSYVCTIHASLGMTGSVTVQ